MVNLLIVFIIGFFAGAIALQLKRRSKFFFHRRRKRDRNHPRNIYPTDPKWQKECAEFERIARTPIERCFGVDQMAPPVFGQIPLEARCSSLDNICDFRNPLHSPPKPHDLISWNRSDVSYQEAEWPICPKCGQLTLMCMTIDWIEMKSCGIDPAETTIAAICESRDGKMIQFMDTDELMKDLKK